MSTLIIPTPYLLNFQTFQTPQSFQLSFIKCSRIFQPTRYFSPRSISRYSRIGADLISYKKHVNFIELG